MAHHLSTASALRGAIIGLAAVTIYVCWPLWPSLVATIRAVPGARPLTMPVGETAAISGFRLAQKVSRGFSAWPFASFGMVTSCWLSPTSKVSAPGTTSTEIRAPPPRVALGGGDETSVGAQPLAASTRPTTADSSTRRTQARRAAGHVVARIASLTYYPLLQPVWPVSST